MKFKVSISATLQSTHVFISIFRPFSEVKKKGKKSRPMEDAKDEI